jgi:CHAD domain-containing protein
MAIGSDPIQGDETDSRPVDRTELVHETRKAIKRMRALARLMRYELGEQEFKRVNDSLRLAGQRLAGARDTQVRLATLDRLRARHRQALALAGIERLRERLAHERAQASEPSCPQEVLADIADMRRLLARWNLAAPDFQTLGPGLQRIYREGRRRYAHVEHEAACDPEQVHDWRKRVKALYYALDMLGGLEVKGMANRATRRAERIGDLLGEEHDLWMLCAYLEQHQDACGSDTLARAKLLKLTARRRARLRKRALKCAAKLYKRNPGTFARRIGSALSR